MKKIIYSLAAMLALSCSFVSCGDDDDTISFPTTPEKAAAGTYSGNWTISSDTETVGEGEGTITIAPTSTPYNADITIEGSFSTTSLNVNATSIANISHANNGFVFNNNDKNPLGTSFTGKIDESGVIGVNFVKEVRVGRKQYKYNYVFWGKKN